MVRLSSTVAMNRTPPLYVSYYTIGNGYEAEAAELERSLNAHRLPHRIEGVVPNGWTWARATQYKAEFLRRMQLEHPDRPIVWLDADARVVRRPLLFDCLDCHFAGHWYRQRELLSGTLYFAPGRTTQHLVEEWIESNRRHSGGRCADQRNLQELVSRRRDLRIVNLPAEYAWIDAGSGNDLSSRAYGRRHPVIVQVQASRRLKKARVVHESVPEAVEEPVV
jgi:hypothetical protein